MFALCERGFGTYAELSQMSDDTILDMVEYVEIKQAIEEVERNKANG